MDRQLNSNQYIEPDEWAKIPNALQKRIRAKEHSLGGGNLKKGAVKEDKQLTKLYVQARKYADWSFMNSKH